MAERIEISKLQQIEIALIVQTMLRCFYVKSQSHIHRSLYSKDTRVSQSK